MPQQQIPARLVPMEGVKRINMIIVCLQQQRAGFTQHNPYAMNINRRENWNCYNCREFGHLARNCRNRRMENRIGKGRRLEYRLENLNGKGDLVVLD